MLFRVGNLACLRMKCGVRFCGGCNPRYDRGAALEAIRRHFPGEVAFPIAEEGTEYDMLLVIGGCSSCCASFEQYYCRGPILKFWDQAHLNTIILSIKEKMDED